MRLGPAITGPATRIYDGSGILYRRWTGWVWPEEPTLLGTVGRFGGTVFGASMAWTAVQASPGLMWVAAGGWCIAAYRAEEEPDEGDDEEDGEPDPVTTDEFIELLHDALGDAKGVHLSTLAERLADLEPGRRWDTAAVRQLATDAGVPVTDSVRVGGSVSTGIKRKDAPPPTPLGAAVVGSSAGQPATATTTALRAERIGEGGRLVRDPADAARREPVKARRDRAA